MSQVYSQSLFVGHAGAGGGIYVPAGYKMVLRWASWFNASALIRESCALTLVFSGVTIVQHTLSQQQAIQEELRIVIPDGEEIAVELDSDVDCSISGYLLTLP